MSDLQEKDPLFLSLPRYSGEASKLSSREEIKSPEEASRALVCDVQTFVREKLHGSSPELIRSVNSLLFGDNNGHSLDHAVAYTRICDLAEEHRRRFPAKDS